MNERLSIVTRLQNLLIGSIIACFCWAETPRANVRVLFLGDKGHHQPAKRFAQIAPVLSSRGIEVTYSEDLSDLNPTFLSRFDCLMVFANIDVLPADREKVLLDYVRSGKGFAPIHCASYCFRNSKAYVDLVGAQFQRHGTGVFRVSATKANHPIMKGYAGFESWDETYTHTMHNSNGRTVLEERVEGDTREPWTWVREEGKGRVFYTAWGHDERTWSNPGFQNLLERGIRWSTGANDNLADDYVDQVAMNLNEGVEKKPYEYLEADIPFYPAGEKWGTIGDNIKKMQAPLPVAEAIKHVYVPKGMKTDYFVADPDMLRSVAMNWDEKGRLWLLETRDYPNELQAEGKGRDQIKICEDTNNDGKADKFSIFADKLSIPTSLAFSHGGAVVLQAPHCLYLKDHDGDGKADERTVLFSGFGTGDTHAGPSNLVYGLDGWFYAIIGYAGFDGTVAGEDHSFRQGFFRFKLAPVGQTEGAGGKAPSVKVTKLEFLRNTSNNSWGVGINEAGELFGSTANGCPSVYMAVANRYFEQVKGWSATRLEMISDSNKFFPVLKNVRQVDHHGGFTAAAGHALYTARNYPAYYWNRTAFVCEPTGRLVATFELRDDGAGYRSRNAWNLAVSDDEWFAPIMAEVGPDGNIWLLDFYNFIIQHNPTPRGFKTGKGAAYETDLRTARFGRVYRIMPESFDAKQVTTMSLSANDLPGLVKALSSDNLFWRKQAQRLIVEQAQTTLDRAAFQKQVAEQLTSILKPAMDQANAGRVDSPAVLHAIAILGQLGLFADAKLTAANADAGALIDRASPAIQLNLVQQCPNQLDQVKPLLERLAQIKSLDLRVTRAAFLKIADVQSAELGDVLSTLLAHPNRVSWSPDVWESATIAVCALNGRGVKGLLQSKADVNTSAIQTRSPANQPRMGNRAPVDSSPVIAMFLRLGEHVGRQNDAAKVSRLIAECDSLPAQYTEALLDGLAKGIDRQANVKLSAEGQKAYAQLQVNATARGKWVYLGKRLGVTAIEGQLSSIVENLRTQVVNASVDDSARVEAARQLMELTGGAGDVVTFLATLITPKTNPVLASGVLNSIGGSQSPEAGQALIKLLPTLTPSLRQDALVMLLRRREWVPMTFDAIEAKQLSSTDLALDQRTMLMNHPDRAISERAKKVFASSGGLPNPDRQKVIEQYLASAKKAGDADKGKVVFKAQCSKCHMHSGEGNRVGPDLTGMATHPKEELLQHILDPNRSVEGTFRVWTAEMEDGRVLTGLLSAESRTSIELVDSEGKTVPLQRDDIAQLAPSNKSLMPEGFEKQLKDGELTDLLAFLTKRGKYLPLSIDKVATAISTKGMFHEGDDGPDRLVFADWLPKTVTGIPFNLVDPRGKRLANVILLNGPQGTLPPKMPRQVNVPCNTSAKAIYLLSGISGWGYPAHDRKSVSMTVRLTYKDGSTEDHPLRNGEHFADYIRRVDVPGSKFALDLSGPQVRLITIVPKKADIISSIDFIKGRDPTAPIVVAVTVESRD